MSADIERIIVTEKGFRILESPEGTKITALTVHNTTIYMAIFFNESGRSELWQVPIE